MSLLDRGRETVTVYPEETWTDPDGNVMTRPGTVGIETRASVQREGQSGNSARRAEQDAIGFETEEVYRIRFPRSFTTVLGAQSAVEWNGKRYSVIGDAHYYNGSRRTAHTDYAMRRT